MTNAHPIAARIVWDGIHGAAKLKSACSHVNYAATLGALYETMLREMRDAAGDSGEFYRGIPLPARTF